MMPTAAGIELRHLRYFAAVFEELHFGRAAERLHMAQPPLSQAIRKLEQDLGVELFVRTSRAVQPTPAGTALAEEAKKVLASFDFALAEARKVGRRNLPLRIGCSRLLPAARLQRFLTELRNRHRATRAEVAHLWAREQVARLRSGQLDLGVFMRSEDYPELECVPLFPGEQVHVFVPASHPLAAKSAVTPESVASQTLLSVPRAVNPAFYDRYMALFEEAGYRFRDLHVIDTTDPRDVLLAVAGGLGVACGPSSLREVGEEGEPLAGVPLDPSIALPEIVVAWRKPAPRQLRGMLDAVRSTAQLLYREALPESP
jgi:DNA-binding transcriptional LysR family regulator